MKRYYLIDHKWLFLFGFILYLFVPYLVGITDAFNGMPGMQLYHDYFARIPAAKINTYLIIIFSWLIAFYFGHFCFASVKPPKKQLHHFEENYADYGLPAIGAVLFITMLLFSYLARNSLFAGYGISYDAGSRGKMSTLLVVFNFFLLYQLIGVKRTSFFIIAGTVITSLLLLSMGGRLYVFQTLIVILVYKTSFAKKRWKLIQIMSVGIFGFFLGSISGIWRLGANYSLERGLYSFFAEPVFTWISASTFLSTNHIPFINLPSNFLTSFLNLIPNTFVNLQPYMVSGQHMGYSYLTPLGADSVWTTYIVNFGIVGSFFFIFLAGFILNLLRYHSENSRFGAVYYMLVCSILPFQFFRDGFSILNKQLFFNFLILPAIILFILKLVKYFNLLAQAGYNKKIAADII